MAKDKVIFSKSAMILPVRKGIYKDAIKDTIGFRVIVEREPVEKATCAREETDKEVSCEGCPNKGECTLFDAETGTRKVHKATTKRPQKRRKWGDDSEFDQVMSNFGATPGNPGEDIDQQLVFGWANVCIQEDGTVPFDWQGDSIDTVELEMAAYNYVLNNGVANQEHEFGTDCGWLVESMMFTKEKMDALGIPEGLLPEGWFVGFYIPDPVVYKKVLDGEYNMFSIEGNAQRVLAEDVPRL